MNFLSSMLESVVHEGSDVVQVVVYSAEIVWVYHVGEPDGKDYKDERGTGEEVR